MALTLERIEALAPDQASLAAARKLLKPGGWPTLAESDGLAWGECQGSGATPYRVVISEADAGYKCTCPSRKFPCKHSLALMWMRAEGKVAFVPAGVPEWVKDWLGRRRASGATTTPEDDAKPKPSIQLAQVEEEAAIDPKAEARAAATRERNRVEREASILSGLDDLDVWLADQVDRGMAAFVAQSTKDCRLIAQRLVDAKAPALASRIDSLPARLFTLPEPARPTAAIQELGQLHLIAEAYRRQELLPVPLKADVRQAVGWTMTREALLADEGAVRCAGRWRVIAVQSEVQPDKLRRIETWLLRESDVQASQFAVLIDFVPVATGASASGYIAGDSIEAELVFYPSAVPLRAQIVRIDGGARPSFDDVYLAATSLEKAFTLFDEQLAKLPWIGTVPLAFTDAKVRTYQQSWFLTDDVGTLTLPLLPTQTRIVDPLRAVGPIDGVALWNGHHCTLLWAQTSLGRWLAA